MKSITKGENSLIDTKVLYLERHKPPENKE